MNIVEIKNFKMKFADKTVIEDLSFNVKKGEIFGLLGANGSGKTTTIRALLGFYRPTGGDLLINNQPYNPEDQNLTIGYLPEERGLYKKETALDNLLYFAKLKNLKNPEAWCTRYLKRVGLAEKANQKLEKLSGGQQQKIQLGVCIMGDPKLLILDEPTKGFDPMNRRLLMEIIEELHQKGCAIILITHYMDEVEKLSGGQQQKIQLGVCIMGDPKLLILDEPTKGFDPMNRRLLMEIIEELHQKGCAIILITHYMDEVEKLCDRALLLKDGRSMVYGTIPEIKQKFGGKSLENIFLETYGEQYE